MGEIPSRWPSFSLGLAILSMVGLEAINVKKRKKSYQQYGGESVLPYKETNGMFHFEIRSIFRVIDGAKTGNI